MKRITKYLIALLVLSLVLAIVPAAFAAEYKGEPGQIVKVVLEVNDIKGIDGNIILNDPDGIVGHGTVEVQTTLGGTVVGNEFFYSTMNNKTTSFKLVYVVTLKASAAEGQSCSVVFNYEVTGEDDMLSDWYAASHTITVEAPKPTEPKPTEPQPTEPKPTEPKPTEPKPTEPKPTQPSVTVDTTKLKNLIDSTDGLDPSLYSADSWAKLQDALKKAKDAMKSKDQSAIDAAAAELEAAINGLVKLDPSALLAAIEKVEKFLKEDSIGAKAKELLDMLQRAKDLLNSQNQAAMDGAAQLLEQLLEELQKEIKDLTKIEEIIKEIEKIVEVAPEGPYCNIDMHYVWPILFFVSLALNAGFIVLIVIYFVRKKKNQADDTPLVDYDIADDVAGVDDTAE